MCHRQSLRNKQHKGFSVCCVNLLSDDNTSSDISFVSSCVLFVVILLMPEVLKRLRQYWNKLGAYSEN